MTLFPNQPELTDADEQRILPHLSNARIPLREWLATRPPVADLKLAVMVEVKRAKRQEHPIRAINRGVLALLLKRIQQDELSEIENNIINEINETESR